MRRSVKKGGGGGGRRRKKGKRTAPVSSIHASCLHARSESRRRRLRESSLRGGADWWLPEGLLILWKSAPSASYLKPSNLPPVSRGEAHLFEIPCRHPLDYTRLSSASFPSEEGGREGGGRRGMLSVEKSLSGFSTSRMGFWMISLKRSLPLSREHANSLWQGRAVVRASFFYYLDFFSPFFFLLRNWNFFYLIQSVRSFE